MFCPNCRNQIPDDSLFCSACGTSLQTSAAYDPPVNLEEQNEHSFAAVLRRALCGGKFLVMCILVSVAAVLSFVPSTVTIDGSGMSTSTSFDLFAILSTIAMWITYANAKNTDPIMAVGGLKFNATIAKIVFIVNWVAAGIIFVCGALLCAMGPMFSALFADESMVEDFYLELAPIFEQYGFEEFLTNITGDFISMFFVVIGVVMLVIGIIMILINIFYYGKVKKFAKNLHISYITNKVTDLRFSTISTWFMIMGILEAIGSLSSFAVNPALAIAEVSGAVAMIVASTWVKELGVAASTPNEMF